VRQKFEEFVFDGDTLLGSQTVVNKTQGVPTLGIQLGLSWWLFDDMLNVALGYQFEQWWSVGRTDDSNADLTTHGIFIRGDFHY